MFGKTPALLLGLAALAAAQALPEDETPAKAGEVLARYLAAPDQAKRKEILEKEIQPLGLPAIRSLQKALDALVPCYRAAKEDRRRRKRRKESIPAVPADQVEKAVLQVVREGAPPPAFLSKAGAVGPLRKQLGLLAGLRFYLLRPKILEFIQAQVSTGASFPGQYRPLKKKYGRAAQGVLLEMVLDKRAIENDRIRIFAARALADVAAPEKPILQALGGLAADEYEPRDLRLQAAVTLARLGEPGALEPFFAEARKLTTRKNPKARVRGWQALAALWHDIGEHAKAVECYDKALPEVKKLVDSKTWPADILSLVHYNRACSLAALGRKKEALADLEKALAAGGVSLETLEKDRELDPLREDPAFRKLLETARKKGR